MILLPALAAVWMLPAAALAQSPLPATRSTLVPFDVSPFPFHGISPRTGKPFLDVSEGERRGRTARSGVLWGRRPTATAACCSRSRAASTSASRR
jgi:hypothetical protein